jgi:AAA domain
VTGAAADVLAESCGIQTRTVASMAAEIKTGHNPFNKQSVLIIDEASTLSNRDHATIVNAIIEAGATMRTIGDPAQHRAVEAGGLWSQLLDTFPAEVACLQINRRQTAASMSDVRNASDQLRKGNGTAAIKTLAGTDRLHIAADPAELIADIVHDWHHDRTLAARTGAAPSRMMAEHHTTLRLLNAAAQDLLRADETITGPGVRVGDEMIHRGDEIITRTQNRTAKADNGRFLRNGVVGTVISVDEYDGRLSVSARFPGYGVFRLDHDWLNQQVRPGVNGAIAPAYAITTHVAQGQTMEAGRAVITDTTSAEGAYVALTRGRNDTRLYVLESPARINRQQAADEAEFPVLLNEPELLEAVAERLSQRNQAETATGVDRAGGRIHQLSLQPFGQILKQADSVIRANREPAQKALRVALDRASLHAVLAPPWRYIDDYGPPPERTDPNRKTWTQAVSARAQYEAIHGKWDPQQTPYPRDGGLLGNRHRDARATFLDSHTFIELEVMVAREGRPKQIRELTNSLTRRVDRALEMKASYLVEMLGQRDSNAFLGEYWDKRARAIETTRLRNGFTTEDKPFTKTVESILGPQRNDDEWQQAAEIVHDAIEPRLQQQTQARSIRR